MKGVGVDEQTDSLPYASSLCGACFEVCPVRIDIPEVLVHLRSQVVDAHRGDPCPRPRRVRDEGARRWAFGDARRLALAERVSGLAGRVLSRFGRTTLPGGRRRGTAARAGLRLDRRPRPARAATGVVPGLVEAHRTGGRSMSARDDILGRVRSALADVRARRSRCRAAPRASGRARRRPGLVALFAERVADYRAVVERCSAADLADRSRAALPDGARVVVPAGLGIEVAGAVVDDGLSAAELDRIDAVVTEAARRHRRDRHGRPRPRSRPGPPRDLAGPRPARLHRPGGPGRRRRTRRHRPARPAAAADLDQRAERHQRHRAGPGRGRARAPRPARHRGADRPGLSPTRARARCSRSRTTRACAGPDHLAHPVPVQRDGVADRRVRRSASCRRPTSGPSRSTGVALVQRGAVPGEQPGRHASPARRRRRVTSPTRIRQRSSTVTAGPGGRPSRSRPAQG